MLLWPYVHTNSRVHRGHDLPVRRCLLKTRIWVVLNSKKHNPLSSLRPSGADKNQKNKSYVDFLKWLPCNQDRLERVGFLFGSFWQFVKGLALFAQCVVTHCLVLAHYWQRYALSNICTRSVVVVNLVHFMDLGYSELLTKVVRFTWITWVSAVK